MTNVSIISQALIVLLYFAPITFSFHSKWLGVKSGSRLTMSNKDFTIGILWDVDGTMSDSYFLGYTSTNEVLKRNGKSEISEEAYHEGTKYTTPRRLAWHVTGDPDNAIGAQLGQEFDDLYVNLVSTESAPLYFGIRELILDLKQSKPAIRYGALSNACTAYVKAVLEVNKIDGIFNIALGADEVPAAKPAPDGLMQICREVNLLPSRCLYIGDSPTDGQAARFAGMKSIGVTWGSHSREKVLSNFEVTVDTVEGLKEALQAFLSSLAVKK